MTFARHEAKRLLDRLVFSPREAKRVVKHLLAELEDQDSEIKDLRLANQSFADTFDKITPELSDALEKAVQHGRKEAYGQLTGGYEDVTTFEIGTGNDQIGSGSGE